MPIQRTAIVVPVYNDWTSFEHLVRELATVAVGASLRFEIFAVNDGSDIADCGLPSPSATAICGIEKIEVIDLACNLGHQRAIAVGLVVVAGEGDFDCVVVLDADGEDRPSDIPELVRACLIESAPVVALRQERSEGIGFRILYRCYRWGFSTLTGRSIRFGNFCALPLPVVKRLIYRPELWNHLAAALIRSGFSIRAIPTKRGQRYDGESRMNFESLMVHGLGAIAVFGDVAFLRILIGAIALGAATLLGLGVVIVIRLLTDLAIPGWASSMAGFLLLILTQAVTTAIGATFLLLSNRSSSHVVPALDAPRYRLGRRLIYRA